MAEPRYVPNSALRAERLPSARAEWDEIQRFALTFDGYKHCGSLERCAALAQAHRENRGGNETLSELRSCLFFEQRSWRHSGYAPDLEGMRYIRGLLEEIRERVAAANHLLS